MGGTTCGLAVDAGRAALECAGIDATEIDLLVLATTTPDQTVPATASSVQHELGLQCGAFDLNAACSGFVYALVAAHGFIGAGADMVLVVGSETCLGSSTGTEAPRSADGAGAVVLEPSSPGQAGWDPSLDGAAQRCCSACRRLQVDGREVFRRAVRDGRLGQQVAGSSRHLGRRPARSSCIRRTCASSGCGDPARRRWKGLRGAPPTGNTSSASIPSLVGAIERPRARRRSHPAVGFGTGMTSPVR